MATVVFPATCLARVLSNWFPKSLVSLLPACLLALHTAAVVDVDLAFIFCLICVLCSDYTVHLHKLVHKSSFKKRAPQSIKQIKTFAAKAMQTADVRIDPKLNKFLWERGVRAAPTRIRVRISRKRSEEEGASQRFYAVVSHVAVDSFDGLQTQLVADEE